jgi:predicted membrane protein
VISVFGETEIFVPDDVVIRVTGFSVFGGVKVRGLELNNGIFSQHRYESPGYARAPKRLHIDATSVFGCQNQTMMHIPETMGSAKL